MARFSLISALNNLFARENSARKIASGHRAGVSYEWSPVTTPMTIATVYRCVKFLSDAVANLPLQYLAYRGGVFREDTRSRLHYLLTVQPDETMSAFDFWSRATQNVLLEGNAYIIPEYDSGAMEISRLVLCERGTVNHDVITDKYTINDPYNGVVGEYDESEVIHIIGNAGINAKHGVSVLTNARLATQTAGAGDMETNRRFAKGGNMHAFVSNYRDLRGFNEYTDNEIDKVADDLSAQLSSEDRFIPLHGQVQVTPFTLSSSDMQFLESRKFTVLEICRFFGVHPSYVFADTANNYKSAEMANVAFLSTTLNPLLRRIESELHRKLIDPSICCYRKFQFDRRGMYACDLDSKMRYYQQLIATGTHTVNDLRRLENMPAVDGGDRILVSANFRALEDVTTDAQEGLIATNKKDKDDKDKDE